MLIKREKLGKGEVGKGEGKGGRGKEKRGGVDGERVLRE